MRGNVEEYFKDTVKKAEFRLSLIKYRFKKIHLLEDLKEGSLLILSAKTLDHQYLPNVFDTVYYPNREPFLYLLKLNETN